MKRILNHGNNGGLHVQYGRVSITDSSTNFGNRQVAITFDVDMHALAHNDPHLIASLIATAAKDLVMSVFEQEREQFTND